MGKRNHQRKNKAGNNGKSKMLKISCPTGGENNNNNTVDSHHSSTVGNNNNSNVVSTVRRETGSEYRGTRSECSGTSSKGSGTRTKGSATSTKGSVTSSKGSATSTKGSVTSSECTITSNNYNESSSSNKNTILSNKNTSGSNKNASSSNKNTSCSNKNASSSNKNTSCGNKENHSMNKDNSCSNNETNCKNNNDKPSCSNNPSDLEVKKWFFTTEQLKNSPSFRRGISNEQEIIYKQKAAFLIQQIGQYLQVKTLCICTAIVFMHRFYTRHPLTIFQWHEMATATFFLACKTEECPRSQKHVIEAANHGRPPLTEAKYAELQQELLFNESVLLQTLGFDVTIFHPHVHIITICNKLNAPKNLSELAYSVALNTLQLSSMCLQYAPQVIGCFCVYQACKWLNWSITPSDVNKHWINYVDETITYELLHQLSKEFTNVYEQNVSMRAAMSSTSLEDLPNSTV